MKSQGSEAFAPLTRGRQRWWATALEIDRSHVSRFASGDSTPSERMRNRIRDNGGPAPELWDVAFVEAPARKAAPPPNREARATPEAVQSGADRLMGMVSGMLDDLESGDGLELEDRVRIADKCAALLASLGKHTGHTIVNPRQIMASPVFIEILDAIMLALEPFPDALRAAGEAVRYLNGGEAKGAPMS